MGSRNPLVFGKKEVFNGFCPRCGLPLLDDGKCRKYHKIKNPKRGRFSGKSKSSNRFNDYQ